MMLFGHLFLFFFIFKRIISLLHFLNIFTIITSCFKNCKKKHKQKKRPYVTTSGQPRRMYHVCIQIHRSYDKVKPVAGRQPPDPVKHGHKDRTSSCHVTRHTFLTKGRMSSTVRPIRRRPDRSGRRLRIVVRVPYNKRRRRVREVG